jgi:hypothetical protein
MARVKATVPCLRERVSVRVSAVVLVGVKVTENEQVPAGASVEPQPLPRVNAVVP